MRYTAYRCYGGEMPDDEVSSNDLSFLRKECLGAEHWEIEDNKTGELIEH